MNKHTDEHPLPELAALRQRLSNLEAEHRELKRQATRTRRPAFSRKFLFSALPVALLLAGVGALYAVDALFIDKTGNVGIGTTSPAAKLDVAGTVRLGAGIADSWFPFTDNNAYITGAETIIRSPSAEFVRIDENGNVGIGTDTPGFPLSFSDELGDKISLWGQSGAHYGLGIQGSLLQIHTSVADDDIAFGYGESDPKSFKETMRIKGNGNVGIGINDPKQKLSVAGDASFSGNVGIGGNETVTGNLTVTKDITVNGHLKFPNGWEVYSGPTNLNFSKNGLKMSINDNERLQSNMPDVPGQKRGFYFLGWGDGNRAEWQSDARFKTDVRTISDALDKVNRLNGITYCWNQTALDYFTRDIDRTISAGPDATPEANQKVWQAERARRYKELSNTNAGVVAQDVEAVLPEAVSTDESGYKSVRYYEMIPLLIEAVKEEDKISQEQAQLVSRQQAEIQRLTAASQLAAQQLNELQEVKQKLARLEAAMSTLAASGSAGDHNALVSSAEGSK